jgi:predicted phosphodiesterase
VDESLYGDKLPTLAPDLVVSCGDLPFDYLEYLVTRANVPLLYVPGNHDPNVKPPDTTWTPLHAELPVPGAQGCENLDGRVVDLNGVRIAGLGGSLRYKEGPNQYTQAQMLRRAVSLELWISLKRVRRGRKLDILVTHAPPFGVAEAKDETHQGFKAFNRLIKKFHPLLLVHGHVHPYGRTLPELRLEGTRIVNAVPSRTIEI